MFVKVERDYEAMSERAARIVAEVVRRKPDAVLGLATGATPVGLYQALIRIARSEGLDFSRVTTFNLDEYEGLPARHPESYHEFMRVNLFDGLGLKQRQTHLESRCCLILANGANKADAWSQMIEGPVSSLLPASALQLHPWTFAISEPKSAAKLKLLDYYQHVDNETRDQPVLPPWLDQPEPDPRRRFAAWTLAQQARDEADSSEASSGGLDGATPEPGRFGRMAVPVLVSAPARRHNSHR